MARQWFFFLFCSLFVLLLDVKLTYKNVPSATRFISKFSVERVRKKKSWTLRGRDTYGYRIPQEQGTSLSKSNAIEHRQKRSMQSNRTLDTHVAGDVGCCTLSQSPT